MEQTRCDNAIQGVMASPQAVAIHAWTAAPLRSAQ